MASELRVDKIVPTTGVPTGGGGGIVQVQYTNRTSVGAWDLATNTETGIIMSVNITPKFSTSKIFLMVSCCLGFANDGNVGIILTKGGSTLTGATGDASGSKTPVSAVGHTDATARDFNVQCHYLDTAGSTSQLTYGVKLRHAENGTTWTYINRNHSFSNSYHTLLPMSSITAMEFSA